LRPITLFPFPTKRIKELAGKVKGMLSVEMSAGQMVEDGSSVGKWESSGLSFWQMGGIVTTLKRWLKI